MVDTPALLVLEDGTVFSGRSCGASGERFGELVFNTALTGYQEVLTDPSYCGQIVVMTYPMIGNYGITAADHESRRPYLEGFVVREMCKHPSNWESVESAPAFLERSGVPAIEGIDTRALTRRLRERGAMRGVISTVDLDPKSLLRKVRLSPTMAGLDLASRVTCEASYPWDEALPDAVRGWPLPFPLKPHVVVMDFGVKRGILRSLVSLGCRVTVVPALSSGEDILALRPDAVLLSNGPGDPEPLKEPIAAIRRLLDARLPLFGICLGHQLLGLALGGKTYKLKFGHHGSNHPVKDLSTGRVEITSQNHGFCVDLSSLPKEASTTHVNLNDGTSEGLAHSQLPAFSVQYHPEASAGPHDARYLFTRFGNMLLERMGVRAAAPELRA
ncbi:MAG: glutamine-hydrolyzing carbamoyl-phosphate synthase small subunit [Elusimicrobia bacterium]|nr:glutamine-hydrolyzing carbamoyl-phosphate synthase small subunit [Elusimicrobiota bacterium]